MGFFNIDEYEPVAERLDRFWKQHSEDGKIETELVSHNDGHYIVRAKVFVGDRQVATGLADERVEQKGVNARNALENAESSAIGRALANFNFQPKRNGSNVAQLRPSREEMIKAQVEEALGATVIEEKTNVTPLKFRTTESVMNDAYNFRADEKPATKKQIAYLLNILDTWIGVEKRTDDKKGHNAFVRFALKDENKRIVPNSNLTFADVRPLFDDHKAGVLGDNVYAWSSASGLPQAHEQSEQQAALGDDEKDDPWTSPTF